MFQGLAARLVAERTAGDPWVGDTDPSAGGSLYARHEATAPAPLRELVPHRFHGMNRRVAQAAMLIVGLVGERLMVDAWRRDRVGQVHPLIQHVHDDLRDRRDDRRAAW